MLGVGTNYVSPLLKIGNREAKPFPFTQRQGVRITQTKPEDGAFVSSQVWAYARAKQMAIKRVSVEGIERENGFKGEPLPLCRGEEVAQTGRGITSLQVRLRGETRRFGAGYAVFYLTLGELDDIAAHFGLSELKREQLVKQVRFELSAASSLSVRWQELWEIRWGQELDQFINAEGAAPNPCLLPWSVEGNGRVLCLPGHPGWVVAPKKLNPEHTAMFWRSEKGRNITFVNGEVNTLWGCAENPLAIAARSDAYNFILGEKQRIEKRDQSRSGPVFEKGKFETLFGKAPTRRTLAGVIVAAIGKKKTEVVLTLGSVAGLSCSVRKGAKFLPGGSSYWVEAKREARKVQISVFTLDEQDCGPASLIATQSFDAECPDESNQKTLILVEA